MRRRCPPGAAACRAAQDSPAPRPRRGAGCRASLRSRSKSAQRSDADRGIEPLLDQVDRPVEQHQPRRHVGKGAQELGHDRQHMQPPEQHRRRDGELAARRAPLPGRRLLDLGQVREHAPRAAEEALAHVGQADRARGAVEQPHAEARLEVRDRACHRRRRAVEPPGGGSEACPARPPRRTPQCPRSDPYYSNYRNNYLRTTAYYPACGTLGYIGGARGQPCHEQQRTGFPARRAPRPGRARLGAGLRKEDRARLSRHRNAGACRLHRRAGHGVSRHRLGRRRAVHPASRRAEGLHQGGGRAHARLCGLPRQPAVHHFGQPVRKRPRLPVPARFLAPPAHQAVGPRPRGRERRRADRQAVRPRLQGAGPSG